MSHENTFHENITDIHFLHSELVRLTEKNAYDLRSDEKLTGCITVKIRYPDFETTSRQEMIDYTSLDDQLIAKSQRSVYKTLSQGSTCTLLGVRFSQLIPFTMQMNLFNNNEEKLNLYKAVDNIKDRFGGIPLKKLSQSRIKRKNPDKNILLIFASLNIQTFNLLKHILHASLERLPGKE